MSNTQAIGTPPGSTLSTPSPTELHDQDPLAAEAEKSMLFKTSSLKPIYLVVATTKCTHQGRTRLGIGFKGGLPWPMIKADMAYFRKVTTNGKSNHSASASRNSVIMGRKTYESIPDKFRPLTGRTNIIVTRSDQQALAERIVKELRTGSHKQLTEEVDIVISSDPNNNTVQVEASSIEEKLPNIVVTSSLTSATNMADAETYCIGGSEIYGMFLKDTLLRPRLRILQTEIQKLEDEEVFECDTFWPEELEGSSEWQEAEQKEVVAWTGIEVPQGGDQWAVDEKVGVRIRVRGWERSAR
ncbi:hypothetical protein H2198_002456 [Neophaeococcomyces mojaviensis]|uniref:Uncharacterized protein n=1 Tax=Neophaeococcomyces mojaviensis TaxID=3383035 RepID=A0ACC3AEV4_9EURO|nr:hypothetical protein H2198_002456 [Knufia sp. JES_112]